MDMNKTQKALMKPKRSRGPPGSSGGERKIRSEKDTVMKVVYISTPMKVKTSASRFRAIVQELTGQQSDVVGIMESSGGRDTWMVPDHHHHHHHHQQHDDHDDGVLPSEKLSGHDCNFGGVLRGNEGFVSSFDDSSGLSFDQFCHQFDVLGSY